MLKQVESARMNWCLSDVVNLHGPAGLRSQSDRAGVAESETVYPEAVAPEQYLQPELAVPPPTPQPQYTAPTQFAPPPQYIPQQRSYQPGPQGMPGTLPPPPAGR